MVNKESKREEIRERIEKEWGEDYQREILFEAAKRRMVDKLVRGGYLDGQREARYSEEFKERLLGKDNLSIWVALENEENGGKMFFFSTFFPGEVLQAVYQPDRGWQASLVEKENNQLGEPVIKAEVLDRKGELCTRTFAVEPGYKSQVSFGWKESRDGRVAEEKWRLVWSRGWRNIEEDKQFKEKLPSFVEENLNIFGRNEKVKGY